MNTKTMRLPPRRVLTPASAAAATNNNKRKERDDPFDRPKPIPKLLKPDNRPEPKPSNQLLAGYLAHEFLTKGTLLGQPWAPPKGKSSEEAQPPQPTPEERERYAEVAGLLKGGGTQLPGVVNPTQLARFLHL
ncbi:hypothetical protein Fmac_027789 [Flemingia macrophylla]|uniref:Uncharacterized protein n=1 Tax=Flemingia macrophylla TaxID=520843 RepID=A0ABD1LIR4_9FABA